MGTGFLIAIIYLTSAGVLFLTAGIIFKENVRAGNNRVVAAMLFFAGLAPFCVALDKTVLADIENLSLSITNIFYVWELFFPALLLFSVIFPEPLSFYKKRRRLFQLAFIPHLFHILLVVFLNDPDKVISLLNFDSSTPVIGPIVGFLETILKLLTALMGFLYIFHTRFFSLINLSYVILAMYFLKLGYKNITNPALKLQVKIVIWGIAIAVGLYVVSSIIPTILSFKFPAGLREIIVLTALVVGPGSIAWAIIKYRFMDIGLLARQSLVYTITTAIVVGGYLLVITELSAMFSSTLGIQSRLLDIIVVVVLLLFFQPLYNQVDDFVRRIFIKSRSDYRHLMEEFSRQLVTVFDIDRLAVILSENLNREMFIERTHFAVFDEKSSCFKLLGETRAYEIENEFLNSLVQKQKPIFTSEIAELSHEGYLGGRLVELGSYLLVPLMDKGRLVGIISLSPKVAGFRYTYEDISLLSVIANQVVVALNNAALYVKSLEKQRLEEELEVARKIQMALLPRNLPIHPQYDFAAFNHPSRQVGGDYYDFINLADGTLGIVIADVSGKGVPAALLMARVQAILQTQEKRGLPIAEMLSQLNEFLVKSSSPDRYVTMFYGELDPPRGKFCFSNAGHNHPFILDVAGNIRYLDIGGLILGAFSGSRYDTAVAELRKDEILVMYTDGISEAMNLQEVEFGEARIIDAVKEARSQSAQYICAHIIKSVKKYAEGAEEIDDMTLVVVKRK
jgi:sigma-B regulation protein RsbU (phosphoserine phosphatase)